MRQIERIGAKHCETRVCLSEGPITASIRMTGHCRETDETLYIPNARDGVFHYFWLYLLAIQVLFR